METQIDYWQAHALLEWQIELGVDEAICEAPVDRYALEDKKTKPANTPQGKKQVQLAPPKAPEIDAAAEASKIAGQAKTLDALREAIDGFSHCAFKQGAKNLVFSDGNPGARVMVIGGPPRRDEDIHGRPFAGPAGALFDKMFEAIGLSRGAAEPENSLYLTTTFPWRPPENRDPTAEEIAMLKPFLLRHIEIKKPELVVLMGNWACATVLGKMGARRLRGTWQTEQGRPVMPMLHPDDLLRTPMAKKDAWADLLEIKARLRTL